VTPKLVKMCKQLASGLGEEVAITVVREYVRSNVGWYIRQRHALEYCLKDANALALQAAQRQAGNALASRTEATRTEQADETAQSMAAYLNERDGRADS
jgi:hypothetical protein